MNKIQFWTVAAFLYILALLRSTHANPLYQQYQQLPENIRPIVEVEDPEAVLEMLARLGQSILRAKHDSTNSKRGLDLGLGRGFSSNQAAKHIMGLAAANFASGPGKRKRTEITLDYPGMEAPPVSGNFPSVWYIKN